MTVVVLGFLVVLWAIVIGSYVKDRASIRPGDSVSAFRDQLHTLQRTQPGGRRSAVAPSFGHARPVDAPRSAVSPRQRQRRRDVLFTLAGAAGFTFLVALVAGSALFIAINVVCDLALAGYVAALAQQQRIARERQQKVRYLHSQQPARGVARDLARERAVLRRSAVN